MRALRYLALVKSEFSGVVPSFSRFLARLFSWKHHQVNWKTRPLFRQVTDFYNHNNYNQCISNALNPAVIHVYGSKLCMLNLKQKYQRTSQENGRGMGRGRGVYPKYCKRYKSTQANLQCIALSIPTSLSHACMRVQREVEVVGWGGGGGRETDRKKQSQTTSERNSRNKQFQ